MLKKWSIILLAVLAACGGSPALCQNLKVLGQAPEITSGRLPNGSSYYIVENDEAKGFADFCIVQPAEDLAAARSNARRCLVSLPHFGSRRPCDFLSERGVGYGEKGFVTYRRGAVEFRFSRIPVADKAVVDSALLMIFDIMDTCPCEQAVIVSGDVDRAKVFERMELFSMTVSRRSPKPSDDYTWVPRSEPSAYFTENPSEGVASIRIAYSAPRMPRGQMNTLAPAVSRQYASWLESILEARLREDFRRGGIPLAQMRFRYFDSSSGPGDEQYVFTVITAAKAYDKAIRRVAAILSSIDNYGVTAEELQYAKDRLASDAARNAGNVRLTNAEYLTRCASAFLYNSALAPDATVNEFFVRSALGGEKELELFNNFASALLDPEANITIGFDTARATLRTDLTEAFTGSWNLAAGNSEGFQFPAGLSDTTSLHGIPAKATVRIKTEKAEPVSGGSLWTFSNGMKVVYRQSAVKGEFSFGFLLRGGAGLIRDLGPGESAFAGDMLAISDVAGMPSDDFRSMLRANGIIMESGVNLSDLRLYGTAPTSKVQLVLKALLSVALNRKVNDGNFEYYRSCEALRIELARLSEQGLREELDSLLCPGYKYHDRKRIASLGGDLPRRAEDFFASTFGNCAGGVLVLVGDLPEEELRKLLCRALGEFPSSRVHQAKPRIIRQTIVGSSVLTEEAATASVGDGRRSVHVALSAPVAFNMTNLMSARIAAAALRAELARQLAPLGWSTEVSTGAEAFPDERFTLCIDCRPCLADGLPEGISPADPMAVTSAVRAALASFQKESIPEEHLKACKAELKNRMDSELAGDEARLQAVLLRFSEGKDTVSGYAGFIDSVSPASIDALNAAFRNGGRAEYIMK